MSGFGTRPTAAPIPTQANRQALVDALMGVPARVGQSFQNMATQGLQANEAFLQGEGADRPFLPSMDNGGRIGALASFLGSNMALGGPAGSLGAGPTLRKITNLKGEKVDAPRVFYRGTNPGDTRRISTGAPEWDAHLFVADNPTSAGMYGSSIAKFEANPDARILYEGTKDWQSVVGKWRKDENMLQYANRAAQAAREAGYDAAWFKRQTDIGTPIFNRDKFRQIEGHSPNPLSAALMGAQPQE